MDLHELEWGIDWIGMAQDGGQVSASCEYGKEPSGSIKFGEFPD
jgi:hypothetical protein